LPATFQASQHPSRQASKLSSIQHAVYNCKKFQWDVKTCLTIKLLANFFAQYYPLLMSCWSKNIFLAVALMVVWLPASAAAAAFSLDYSIGFNGHFQLDHWLPLSVVVENRGRAVRGTLEVIVTSGSEYAGDVYRTVYASDADLPSDSVKRYQFTVMIRSFTHDLIIRLRQTNKIIYSKSVNLRSHFTEKRLAIVVGDFVSPDILSVLPDQLHPVNVRPKFLPETWYGYDSVRLLIMEADSIRQLSEVQFQALRRWLRQGGYLVMGSDLNYGSLTEKRIQDILPIKVNGYQRFFDLKSLEHFCSLPLRSVEPFLILNARIDDSNIVLKENDTPIITRKEVGYGRIVFLSFNVNTPPFSRWEGRSMFWDKILLLGTEPAGPELELDEQKILDAMLAGMPLKFPGFKAGVIFIGVYLIFLRVLLKKIEKPGRGRWRYGLGLLAMIIIFSGIGYRSFYYPDLRPNLTYNTFCQLEISGADVPASLNYIIGLYALQPSAYALNFGSGAYPVRHILSKRSQTGVPDPYVLQTNGGVLQITGSLDRWSHNFYRLQLDVDSPLTGYARQDKSFLTLTVENKLPHNLVDCLVYYRRRFIFVDDILANTTQVLTLSVAQLKETEIFNDQEVENIMRHLDGRSAASFLRSAQKNLMENLLYKIHETYQARDDRMILIGWMPAGLVRPEFVAFDPPGTGLTMVSWQLPVEATS
jgi:hypothetical protein